MRTTNLIILSVLASSTSVADVARPATLKQKQKNFVTCPIVLDTKDVPCWVAEYEGERYFLTVQTGRSNDVVFSPSLMHKVLVEGIVTDQPRMCGGIVLTDVKLSVIEAEVSPECDKILPGDAYHVTGPRPITPDGDPPGGKSTAVRRPINPERSAAAIAANQKKMAAERQTAEFTIPYYFDSNYLPFPTEQATVDRAADYAALAQAQRVEVVGYRGSVVLSDGSVITEKEGLAERRARTVAAILEDFGVPKAVIAVSWNEKPEHSNGVRDYEKRRVNIAVIPAHKD
ncbi:OmpA family protein [Povalibacter sp.]|uniref:OmpA family protein n=1 Tax=Povalibacter sp. TaxID=1962978 RepID=UPI002F42A4D1